MRYTKYILALFIFGLTFIGYAEDVTVVNGHFKSKQRTAILKTFAVSKGDVLDIQMTVDHKKRGVNMWINQHPGGIKVFDFEEWNNGTHTMKAPADAIYEIYYGGERCEFDITITNHTDKPTGPGRGDIVFVRMPDTLHASGYVSKKVGENYSLVPYTEKVVMGTTVQSEMLVNRDFFTGVDKVKLVVPGDIRDDYREQKLLSYSISLVCQSPEVYNAMLGVVKGGIDTFTPSYDKFMSKKPKKTQGGNQYKFTENLDAETNHMETATELITLGDEAASDLAPGTVGAEALSTTAFLLDTDGMKKMALNKGLEAAGAPKEMMSVMNAVEEIPSPADLLKQGVDKYAPKVSGSAVVNVHETFRQRKPYIQFPDKEFWIQSAINFGKNIGGCFDVPGHPTQAQNGQKIECWDIDDGIDRKFKIVKSLNFDGYHQIVSALPGNPVAIDNYGGDNYMARNGNDIRLWEKHNGKCQAFRFEHVGGGKFRIYNYDGYMINTDNRKSDNGTNIHIWEPHNGAWTEFYLVDPITRQPFIPSGNYNDAIVRENALTVSKKGGVINETVEVSKMTDPLYTGQPDIELTLDIYKNGGEAKAKLMVEAKYRITDFTDVVKYKRTTQEVNCKDFWTAYKINYHYDIMFKDQVKDYYTILSENQYRSTSKPFTEVTNPDDWSQRGRLARYKLLQMKK